MSDNDSKFLDTFSVWLRRLGRDASALSDIVAAGGVPRPTSELVVGALNYLFKCLDLIPDGVDDIGYLDDAFVLRVACEQAVAEDLSAVPETQAATLQRLAEEAVDVRAFLGDVFPRLSSYVTGLRRGAARGRSVSDILEHPDLRAAFVREVGEFASVYRPPSFTQEEKNLVKLQAFFAAKLPK